MGQATIFRISSKGGEASAVTGLEPALGHQVPQFLPDGRHFLYFALIPSAVYLAELDGSKPRRLLDADAAAVYVPSGYLLFVRQRTLFAQAFDPVRLELTGNPFRVAAQVASGWAPALSVSATGTVVYRSGSVLGFRRPFVWFDRSGKEIGRVGENAGGGTVAFAGWQPSCFRRRAASGPPEIWELTFDRGGMTRVTSNGKANLDPVWSPDGSQIVFSASDPTGASDLYRKPMTGDGKEELLLPNDRGVLMPSDWSTDGRFLLYGSFDRTQTRGDIWALPMDGDRKPFPVVQTTFEEKDAQFSPDGKWIAYQSNETGRFEIYMQPFPPAPDAKSRSPLMAVRRCGGGATAENCSTSRWTAG